MGLSCDDCSSLCLTENNLIYVSTLASRVKKKQKLLRLTRSGKKGETGGFNTRRPPALLIRRGEGRPPLSRQSGR